MNSLKFLAVTTSLETGRDVVGRFRMRDECSLPRFIEGQADEPETVRPSWWRRLWARVWRVSKWNSPFQAEVSASPATREEFSKEPAIVSTAKSEPTEKLDASGDVVAAVTHSGMRAERREVVQVEFRFEHVKVVCNDLHDADIEIVSPSSRKQSKPLAADAGIFAGA